MTTGTESRAPASAGALLVCRARGEAIARPLLVSPAHRSPGVGRTLVWLLVEESRRFPVSTAWVRVVPENVAALRCHTAAGFAQASVHEESRFNALQPRRYRWLHLNL